MLNLTRQAYAKPVYITEFGVNGSPVGVEPNDVAGVIAAFYEIFSWQNIYGADPGRAAVLQSVKSAYYFTSYYPAPGMPTLESLTESPSSDVANGYFATPQGVAFQAVTSL